MSRSSAFFIFLHSKTYPKVSAEFVSVPLRPFLVRNLDENPLFKLASNVKNVKNL